MPISQATRNRLLALQSQFQALGVDLPFEEPAEPVGIMEMLHGLRKPSTEEKSDEEQEINAVATYVCHLIKKVAHQVQHQRQYVVIQYAFAECLEAIEKAKQNRDRALDAIFSAADTWLEAVRKSGVSVRPATQIAAKMLAAEAKEAAAKEAAAKEAAAKEAAAAHVIASLSVPPPTSSSHTAASTPSTTHEGENATLLQLFDAISDQVTYRTIATVGVTGRLVEGPPKLDPDSRMLRTIADGDCAYHTEVLSLLYAGMYQDYPRELIVQILINRFAQYKDEVSNKDDITPRYSLNDDDFKKFLQQYLNAYSGAEMGQFARDYFAGPPFNPTILFLVRCTRKDARDYVGSSLYKDDPEFAQFFVGRNESDVQFLSDLLRTRYGIPADINMSNEITHTNANGKKLVQRQLAAEPIPGKQPLQWLHIGGQNGKQDSGHYQCLFKRGDIKVPENRVDHTQAIKALNERSFDKLRSIINGGLLGSRQASPSSLSPSTGTPLVQARVPGTQKAARFGLLNGFRLFKVARDTLKSWWSGGGHLAGSQTERTSHASDRRVGPEESLASSSYHSTSSNSDPFFGPGGSSTSPLSSRFTWPSRSTSLMAPSTHSSAASGSGGSTHIRSIIYDVCNYEKTVPDTTTVPTGTTIFKELTRPSPFLVTQISETATTFVDEVRVNANAGDTAFTKKLGELTTHKNPPSNVKSNLAEITFDSTQEGAYTKVITFWIDAAREKVKQDKVDPNTLEITIPNLTTKEQAQEVFYAYVEKYNMIARIKNHDSIDDILKDFITLAPTADAQYAFYQFFADEKPDEKNGFIDSINKKIEAWVAQQEASTLGLSVNDDQRDQHGAAIYKARAMLQKQMGFRVANPEPTRPSQKFLAGYPTAFQRMRNHFMH